MTTARERITAAAREAGWAESNINGHLAYIEYRRGRRAASVYYDGLERVHSAGFTSPSRSLHAPTRDTATHVIGFLYAVPGARFEAAPTGDVWTVIDSARSAGVTWVRLRSAGVTWVRLRSAPRVTQSVPLDQLPALVGRWIGVPQ